MNMRYAKIMNSFTNKKTISFKDKQIKSCMALERAGLLQCISFYPVSGYVEYELTHKGNKTLNEWIKNAWMTEDKKIPSLSTRTSTKDDSSGFS